MTARLTSTGRISDLGLYAVHTAGVAALAGIVFTLAPEIDLVAAAAIRIDRDAPEALLADVVRHAFIGLFAIACLIVLIATLRLHAETRSLFGTSARSCLFVLACLAIGPGVVTNVLLKDQWGRARPRDVIELGGELRFTPALQPARQCHKNCSFVSGEASSIFMIFFSLAMVARRRRQQLFRLGIAAGGTAGLIRMMQGGHFFSDVVFAGVLMAAVAMALHVLLHQRTRTEDPTPYPDGAFVTH